MQALTGNKAAPASAPPPTLLPRSHLDCSGKGMQKSANTHQIPVVVFTPVSVATGYSHWWENLAGVPAVASSWCWAGGVGCSLDLISPQDTITPSPTQTPSSTPTVKPQSTPSPSSEEQNRKEQLRDRRQQLGIKTSSMLTCKSFSINIPINADVLQQ